MKILICALVMGSLFSQAAAAQQGAVAVSARSGIDGGTKRGSMGVKSGDVTLITATYAEQAVDCGLRVTAFEGEFGLSNI